MSARVQALLAVLLLALSGCYQSRMATDVCDGDALRAALAAARPGDMVHLGACTIDGPLAVPPGVTLRGVGAPSAPDAEDGLRIVGPAGSSALVTLEAGDPPGGLEDLEVDANGAPGVIISGTGGATLTSVVVRARGATALLVDSIGSLTARDVQVLGPADEGPNAPHTNGLVVQCTTHVDLTHVTATGLHGFGVLLMGSSGTLQQSVLADTLGVNLLVYGGSVDLEDVTTRNARSDLGLLPPYDMVIANHASVRAQGLVVTGSEGYGLLQSDAPAIYAALEVSHNAQGGMWVQNAPELVIDGGTSMLSDNGRVGLRVAGVARVALHDVHVSSTRNLPGIVGETGTIEIGDGIDIAASDPALVLDHVSTADNPRVGIVVDLGGASLRASGISNVTVDGTGDALGFVVQDGTAPDGWDDAVLRQGATMANDRAFGVGFLDGVARSGLPPPSAPPGSGCSGP